MTPARRLLLVTGVAVLLATLTVLASRLLGDGPITAGGLAWAAAVAVAWAADGGGSPRETTALAVRLGVVATVVALVLETPAWVAPRIVDAASAPLRLAFGVLFFAVLVALAGGIRVWRTRGAPKP